MYFISVWDPYIKKRGNGFILKTDTGNKRNPGQVGGLNRAGITVMKYQTQIVISRLDSV